MTNSANTPQTRIAQSGTVNTGSGGGGASPGTTEQVAGSGGSGLVLIAYPST
jgi:hypothetical protein